MNLFWRSSCVLCGYSTKQAVSLCADCQNDLPKIESSCFKCGIPVAVGCKVCGQCIQKPPDVDYNFSAYHYESPIDYLIAQLKFEQKLFCADILGHIMVTSLKTMPVQDNYPDVILPVPLHKKRLIKRGFNQSLEISKVVSKALKIPIDYQLATRIRATKAQMELTALQRKKNIKGCFQVRSMSGYNHVVLIDDVVTTGSTTNELAKSLKASGIETVGVWAIARAKVK